MGQRRFLVRSLWVGAFVCAPVGLLAYGCDSPTQYDDLCGFLKDPNNCYATFFEDIQARCGSAAGPPIGAFPGRDKLDTCFLQAGGQVFVDPPLDLAKPLTDDLSEPIRFTLVNPDTTQCAIVEFGAKYDFTIEVISDPLPDAGPIDEDLVIGGKFSMLGGKLTDTLDVTCPDGFVQHKFDRLQVTTCPEYEAMLPHAEVDYNPGGVDQVGVLRLRIYYPPLEGALENGTPQPIHYFECSIPAAPPLCANGEKDGLETDVDCGGSFCTSRCRANQGCIVNGDCESDNCGLIDGIRQCIGP